MVKPRLVVRLTPSFRSLQRASRACSTGHLWRSAAVRLTGAAGLKREESGLEFFFLISAPRLIGRVAVVRVGGQSGDEVCQLD